MGILVVICPEQDRSEWTALLDGMEWSEFPALPRIFRVEGFTPESFPLRDHPGVESVEPDDLPIRGQSQELAIDASVDGASWAIARIIRRSAPWRLRPLPFPLTTFYRCERDGTGVDLYVLDSGVRTTHAEFGGRVTQVYEAVSSGGAGDDNGHGTGTASCAAGATVGTARGAEVFSFKVLDSMNLGTNTRLVSGINQVLTHYAGRSGLNRPAVVNMSLVGFGSTINSAVSSMIDAGMVVVACSGNTREDLGVITNLPAESDADVIVVGGHGPADIPYYNGVGGSNWGTRVDVSAPSQRVWRANIGGDDEITGGSNGTSFGCAYASGAIACMLQGHPRLTTRTQVQAVCNHVRNTATTGKLANDFGITLPDRMLYLNPDQAAPEPITGL